MNAIAIFALALLAFAQAEESPLKQKVGQLKTKCAADSGATEDEVKIFTTRGIPSTDGEKCFMECIYRGLGFVKDNGFDAEGSKKLASARYAADPKGLEDANKMIETCSTTVVQKEGEKCSLGRAVRECLVTHGQKTNFFPTA